jgi:hypothetical protein
MVRILRYFSLTVLMTMLTLSLAAQTVKIGVMLPLHDENGDGRRMVEYYRGVLMACDSMKMTGMSIDVKAWNLAENANVNAVLSDPDAAKCDLIIGPLYSKQVKPLSDFVKRYDIKLMIPFSIEAPEVYQNRNIFQVYQNANTYTEAVALRFVNLFKDYHPVIIDCHDNESTKGLFTSTLRRIMDNRSMTYNLTSLRSTEEQFARAFSTNQSNVVVLNTARLPQMIQAFTMMNKLRDQHPELKITVMGYTEWMKYAKQHADNFYKYDVYIPTNYFYNPLTSSTKRIEQKYRWNFHEDMQESLPRMGITGFDHAQYFLRGLRRYSKQFTGEAGSVTYAAAQTPLQFSRIGNGGMQNHTLLFVHYMPERRIVILDK